MPKTRKEKLKLYVSHFRYKRGGNNSSRETMTKSFFKAFNFKQTCFGSEISQLLENKLLKTTSD